VTRSSRLRIEVIELDETETHPFARALADDDKTEIKVLAAVAQRLASDHDIVELPRSRAPRSTASGNAPLEIDDEITTITRR
jgi:hypothetical protein